MLEPNMPQVKTSDKSIARILAFDFGTQHIGVAVGQTLTQNAQALKSLKARDGIPQWHEIKNLLDEWRADLIIVGLPLHMDGSENELCQRARKFANRINGRFQVPIEMVDERLSSEAAESLDIAGDIHGKSAVLIMHTWFNQSI